jgi:hypothetical protein
LIIATRCRRWQRGPVQISVPGREKKADSSAASAPLSVGMIRG